MEKPLSWELRGGRSWKRYIFNTKLFPHPVGFSTCEGHLVGQPVNRQHSLSPIVTGLDEELLWGRVPERTERTFRASPITLKISKCLKVKFKVRLGDGDGNPTFIPHNNTGTRGGFNILTKKTVTASKGSDNPNEFNLLILAARGASIPPRPALATLGSLCYPANNSAIQRAGITHSFKGLEKKTASHR